MAITESLPVGNEVATSATVKSVPADAAAFSRSFAAAGIATPNASSGKTDGLAALVRGQQDLAGWDAGRGLNLQEEANAGDATASQAQQVAVGQAAAKPDLGSAGGAVSSLIGKQEIDETGQAPEAVGKDVQQALADAVTRQTVDTADATNGDSQTISGSANGSQAAKVPTSAPDAAPVLAVGNSTPDPATPATKGASALPVNTQGIVQAEALQTTAAIPALVVSQAPAEDEIGAPVIPTAAPSPTTALAASNGKAFADTTANVASPANHSLPDSTARFAAGQSATKTHGSQAQAGSPVQSLVSSVASKTVAKGSTSPAANLTPQATSGSVAVTSNVSRPAATVPAAVVPSPAPAPAPAAARSAPTVEPVSEPPATDTAALPLGTLTASVTPDASTSGTTRIAPARVTSAPSASPNTSAAVAQGPRKSGSASASTATVAKHTAGMATGSADSTAVATPLVAQGDGASVLPVAVAPAQTAPLVTSASTDPGTDLAGAVGIGSLSQVGAKSQAAAGVAKIKDGSALGTAIRRNNGTAETTRGAHAAASDPASVSSGSVSSSSVQSTPPTVKTAAEQGKAQDALPTGAPAAVLNGSGASSSNVHAVAAAAIPSGVPATAAPVRAETAGTAVSGALAGPASTPEDGALASGLSGSTSSGLSSGLSGSGQGHTTLQATPTVLEVGVPGGTHGWLKIRAELGEGGTVHASMSSATQAGQDTLRKELPAMSAYLESEHVPVSLQMVHAATSANGTTPAGLSVGDGLTTGLGFGSGAGGHSGTNPEQGRNDTTTAAGVSSESTNAGSRSGGGQQGSQGGTLVQGLGTTGSGDGVSAAVANADADWSPSPGYGGASLTTGGSWVNVIA